MDILELVKTYNPSYRWFELTDANDAAVSTIERHNTTFLRVNNMIVDELCSLLLQMPSANVSSPE